MTPLICGGTLALFLAMTTNPHAEEWSVAGKLLGKNGKRAEDISGIACSGGLGYPRECLVIDDETQFAQWVTLPERGRLVAGATLPLVDDTFEGKPVELDGEGAAFADGSFFVIGSFGSPRSADGALDEEGAARLAADSHAFRLTPYAEGVSVTDSNALREWILADADLRPSADRPLAMNGLTVEGIAVVADTAYVGFRGPVVESSERAVLMELPIAKFFREPGAAPATHFLALGTGRGIRDLSPVGDELLILAGPVLDTDAGDAAPNAYSLYRWDPRMAEGPARVFDIPTFTHGSDRTPDKPEAIVPIEISSGTLTVLILFDGPDEGAPRAFAFPW